MVKMDEYFLHSYYLVCGATRELRRRLGRERMEGRLKMVLKGKCSSVSTFFLSPLNTGTISSILIITIAWRNYNEALHSSVFLPFSIIFAFVILPLPYLSPLLHFFQDLLARSERFFPVRRWYCNDYDTILIQYTKAWGFDLPMDGSPTATVPKRWWMTHRIRAGTLFTSRDGWCWERVADLIAFSTILAIVLIANLE